MGCFNLVEQYCLQWRKFLDTCHTVLKLIFAQWILWPNGGLRQSHTPSNNFRNYGRASNGFPNNFFLSSHSWHTWWVFCSPCAKWILLLKDIPRGFGHIEFTWSSRVKPQWTCYQFNPSIWHSCKLPTFSIRGYVSDLQNTRQRTTCWLSIYVCLGLLATTKWRWFIQNSGQKSLNTVALQP